MIRCLPMLATQEHQRPLQPTMVLSPVPSLPGRHLTPSAGCVRFAKQDLKHGSAPLVNAISFDMDDAADLDAAMRFQASGSDDALQSVKGGDGGSGKSQAQAVGSSAGGSSAPARSPPTQRAGGGGGSASMRAAGRATVAAGRMQAAGGGGAGSPVGRPEGSGPSRSGQEFLAYRSAIRRVEPVVPARVANSVVEEDV